MTKKTDEFYIEEGTQEQRIATIKRKLAKLPREAIDGLERMTLAQIASLSDTSEGFFAFYKVVHKKDIPEHAKVWIDEIYKSHEANRGIVIRAFRGSTKTTTITITFTAWRIGREPEKSNLLIQVGDDIAQDNTKAIADIIANNEGFKMVFPNIEPDMDKGWGVGGYEVKRTDISYGEWRGLNTDRKDPTLVGVGYKSREIIGKHPTGVLAIDDIHDENNTGSSRELANVIKIIQGTIFPAMLPGTWKVFVGTPWTDNDTLSYVAGTGEYDIVMTPVKKDGTSVWPERFSDDQLRAMKNITGSLEYARMYELDLTQAKNRVLKYMSYPYSEVRFNWPIQGGTDYASNKDAYKNIAGQGDYFAICYLAKLPGGGAVVVDGVLDRCTQGQAEAYMLRAQEIYPMWQGNIVEAVGKGDDFFQVLMRHPNLRIIPMTPKGKSKEERIERILGPWLENGTIRVSDADTPFLVELRRELDAYPNIDHDDALDALFYAMQGIPEILQMPSPTEDLVGFTQRKREVNPFLAFGRH